MPPVKLSHCVDRLIILSPSKPKTSIRRRILSIRLETAGQRLLQVTIFRLKRKTKWRASGPKQDGWTSKEAGQEGCANVSGSWYQVCLSSSSGELTRGIPTSYAGLQPRNLLIISPDEPHSMWSLRVKIGKFSTDGLRSASDLNLLVNILE